MKGLFAIVLVLAATPAFAEDLPACSRWVAQMQEDEGGEVLTALTCAIDAPQTGLALACAGGTMLLRYDLANGAPGEPPLEDRRAATFAVDDAAQPFELAYEEMDGWYATTFDMGDPLVDRLRHGATLRISVADDVYPAHSFSLAGSSKALDALEAQCD